MSETTIHWDDIKKIIENFENNLKNYYEDKIKNNNDDVISECFDEFLRKIGEFEERVKEIICKRENEKEEESEIGKHEEDKDNEEKPKIRVVDLNKLRDVVPQKKSVTFDSSVIILTSSDEENYSTPKKSLKNTTTDTLKSVLKNNGNISNKKVVRSSASSSTSSSDEDAEEKEENVKKRNLRGGNKKFNLRKSSRQFNKEVEVEKKRDSLKFVFKKNGKTYESSSTPSSSSSKSNENDDLTLSDAKLHLKVYIPLIKQDLNELQAIYERDRDMAQIERLNIINCLSRSKKNDGKEKKNTERKKEETDGKDAEEKFEEDKADQNKHKDVENNKGEEEESVDYDVAAITAEDKDNNTISLNNTNGRNAEEDNDKGATIIATDDLERIGSECETLANEKIIEEEEKENDEEINKSKENETVDDESQNNNEKNPSEEGDNVTLLKNKSNEDDSSDTDDFNRKIKKYSCNKKKKLKVKKTKVVSDSDESDNNEKDKVVENSSSTSDEDDKEAVKPVKKSNKRRIKRTKSSGSDSDTVITRKKIKRVLGRDSLSEMTLKAEEEEKQRKARIAEKQKKYNSVLEEKIDSTLDELVLEYADDKTKELLSVDEKLVKKLKPHQANGIRFMWDACFETLERTRTTPGSGCILAHCMGLGKTLQVIALVHTLITNSDKTNITKVLVVCPVNTVLNWKDEFKKWLGNKSQIEIYELVSCKINQEKEYRVKEWHEEGGVLIIGYSMFRILSNPDYKRTSKKGRVTFQNGFVDPGPDLVICDEGHLLKNEKTSLSIAMNRIKTLRRIVLTGTPLQNNLKEYWCMVQFIKPNLLGTYREYMNRFVHPITNGQYVDSTQYDIMVMRKRSHILHKLLDGVVQRRDYSVLEPYLPPKYEYVIFIKLSPVQVKLYQHYMTHLSRKNNGDNGKKASVLFQDFQQLQRICTHPRVLMFKSPTSNYKSDESCDDSEGSLRDFVVHSSESCSTGSSSTDTDEDDDDDDGGNHSGDGNKKRMRMTRSQRASKRGENSDVIDEELEKLQRMWWQDYCDGDELDNIDNSFKMKLLFKILKECEEIGDKVLIFSQSLLTLNTIEYFLEKIDAATVNNDKSLKYTSNWILGLDYFRLDGSSSCDNRHLWCESFNNPANTRARLFLISTKAGGLGINLIAANRVIIFDVSWNPSHDIQSIYRVYRFGQTKPSYVYRFVSYGTMEMKIYERQVTKQAISKRVLDEQQIDRHYTQHDLMELYKCDLEPDNSPIPLVPKDILLGEILQNNKGIIHNYHIHQSLLENREEEGLNEEERRAAWEEFENEKTLKKTMNMPSSSFMTQIMPGNPQTIHLALRNIIQKENPGLTYQNVNAMIPMLVNQLKNQLAENNVALYNRVQQEMNQIYIQNQISMFNQQQQNAILGNMSIHPDDVTNILYGSRMMAPSSTLTNDSDDLIELND